MDAIPTRITDELERAGVKSETFVSYAPPVVAAASLSNRSDEEALYDSLSGLYARAIASGVDAWSVLHFSAEAIAETFSSDRSAILSLIDGLIEVVEALGAGYARESLVLQR